MGLPPSELRKIQQRKKLERRKQLQQQNTQKAALTSFKKAVSPSKELGKKTEIQSELFRKNIFQAAKQGKPTTTTNKTTGSEEPRGNFNIISKFSVHNGHHLKEKKKLSKDDKESVVINSSQILSPSSNKSFFLPTFGQEIGQDDSNISEVSNRNESRTEVFATPKKKADTDKSSALETPTLARILKANNGPKELSDINKQKWNDMLDMRIATPVANKKRSLDLTSRYCPLDWSLKTSMTVRSYQDFDWCRSLKGGIASDSGGVFLFSNPKAKSKNKLSQLQKALLYYQYTISYDKSNDTINEIEWSQTLTSLFLMLKNGYTPYFYLKTESFVILFKSKRLNSKNVIEARFSRSNRIWRNRFEDLNFQMPFGSKNEMDNELSEVEDEDEDEEDIDDEEEATQKRMNGSNIIHPDRERERLQIKLSRKKTNDWKPESMLIFEDDACHDLYEYFLNIDVIKNNATILYSPVLFLNATLKTIQMERNGQVTLSSSNQEHYAVVFKGTILPTNYFRIFEIFKDEPQREELLINSETLPKCSSLNCSLRYNSNNHNNDGGGGIKRQNEEKPTNKKRIKHTPLFEIDENKDDALSTALGTRSRKIRNQKSHNKTTLRNRKKNANMNEREPVLTNGSKDDKNEENDTSNDENEDADENIFSIMSREENKYLRRELKDLELSTIQEMHYRDGIYTYVPITNLAMQEV